MPLGEREPTIAGTGEVIGPLDRDGVLAIIYVSTPCLFVYIEAFAAPVNGDEASVASTDYGDNETGLQRVRVSCVGFMQNARL